MILSDLSQPSLRRFLLHVAGGLGLGLGAYAVSVLVGAPLPSYVVGLIAATPGWRELSDFVNQTGMKTVIDVTSWVLAGLLAMLVARALNRGTNMSGWKSKLGAALIIAGGVVTQLPFDWAKPAGDLMVIIGTGLLGVGIAHKVDRLRPK